MKRYMLLTPLLTNAGVYQYQPLTLEQAQAWLDQGSAPLCRLPLLGSIMTALTGRQLVLQPDMPLTLETGDEALIAQFQFPGSRAKLWSKRERLAQQAPALRLDEVAQCTRFGLLRKAAPLDSYIRSITQWDWAFRADHPLRYLVHEAVLEQYGIYQLAHWSLDEALTWLEERPVISQLRYDGTCKALEVLSDRDIPLWENHLVASLMLRPGDQGLVVSFTYPDGQAPKPYVPYTRPLSAAYARAHTDTWLLTRLSDDVIERHSSAFSPTTPPANKALAQASVRQLANAAR